MLSRIAESLFWIGRYVERADDTARILDAYSHRLLEDPWIDEVAACRSCSASWASRPPRPSTATSQRARACSPSTTRTRARSPARWSAARENARGARETMSTEMWEALNVTWDAFPQQRRAAERLGPHAFLSFVRERAAMVSGLADSTMSRDDGWRFLVLGRSLERVDMTARLLVDPGAARRPRAVLDAPLLRACGADETFLRTYHGAMDAALGRGVPAAGPAVPALGVPRARRPPRGACASSTPTWRGPASAHRPADHRAGPHRPGVRRHRRPARAPARAAARPCRRPARGVARRSRPATSSTPPR